MTDGVKCITEEKVEACRESFVSVPLIPKRVEGGEPGHREEEDGNYGKTHLRPLIV